jgi:ParB-like chromosome segregation protein Spo0J
MIENPLWPANKIEHWPIDILVRFARNARVHTPTQIDQIAASIREWGWTMPVLVDENGTILAGHARVLAARKLGLAEVPVIVARGWSEAQSALM